MSPTDVLRRWARAVLAALSVARAELDDLNVYPVPDGDTGTNLYLTWEAACEALPAGDPTFAEAVQAFGRGALLGARGNSGVITSQLIRACGGYLSEHLPPGVPDSDDVTRGTVRATGPAGGSEIVVEAVVFAEALVFAVDAAYGAVAQPVEGTMLTVAREAAAAARTAAHGGVGLAEVCRAATAAGREALGRTTAQLEPLRRAGVVDAGGAGLVVILGAMESVLSGRGAGPGSGVPAGAPGDDACAAPGTDGRGRGRPGMGGRGIGGPGTGGRGIGAPGTGGRGMGGPGSGGLGSGGPGTGGSGSVVLGGCLAGAAQDGAGPGGPGDGPTGPAYEVMYLLDAPDDTIGALRQGLDALGDSAVVVGGDGLWNVHVHTDDVGGAVEAGIGVGRPYRIRVTRFADPGFAAGPRIDRAVIAVAAGGGLAELFTAAGARVVATGPGRRCSTAELLAAIERAGAPEVVLLPNDNDSLAAAEAAATAARQGGARVAVIPTRAQVQGLAAIAVHDPHRSFDDDVVHLSAAAGQTRHGAVTIAAKDAWTTAGTCRAGDALGVVDGDFALITDELVDAAIGVADRLLAGGGELVTIVRGREGSQALADALARHVRRSRRDVDVVVYDGGQDRYPLLIGVE